MTVDSSALIAILLAEPQADVFTGCTAEHLNSRIAAPTGVEVSIMLEARGDQQAAVAVKQLVQRRHPRVAPFLASHAEAAREASRRFGRGRHKAALNYGDCMSYGFGKVEGERLLLKGNDFPHTPTSSRR